MTFLVAMSYPRPFLVSTLLLLAGYVCLPSALHFQEKEKEQVKGVFAEPADAAEVVLPRGDPVNGAIGMLPESTRRE